MNILNYIGNTPLVKLNLWSGQDIADIYVKLESFNPGNSIKTRVAYRMIQEAEMQGKLNKDKILIEATGGNTGMGIAIISLIRGYKFIAVVPNNYSQARIDLLKIHGAEVILSDSSLGNDSHITLLKRKLLENNQYFNLDQFKNEASIRAHYYGTANEIIEKIYPDVFVSCVGSGGTFNGIGKRLSEQNKKIKLFVVQPEGCDIYSGKSIPHKIQGVSLGIKPDLMDYSLVSDVISVSENEVREMLQTLLKKEALFLGASSGANIVAAYKIAKKIGKGKIVCTVAPDSGQYYLNDFYNGGI